MYEVNYGGRVKC